MFSICCDTPERKQYSIKHDPIPFHFSEYELHIFEYLLWYVPGISSAQSRKEEVLAEPRYNEYLFQYLLRLMNLKESDVYWVQGKEIEEDLINNYTEVACMACQKVILTGSQIRKVNTLLRHIRNSIAHARFNVHDDVFIGFDKDGEKYTGFIKLKINALNTLATELLKENLRERLIADAFTRLGYQVEMGIQHADMVVSKAEKRYAIEFKRFSYKGQYIIGGEFEKYINNLRKNYGADEMLSRVVIVDIAILSESNKRAAENLAVRFIDWQELQQILDGTDVLMTSDVIKEHLD